MTNDKRPTTIVVLIVCLFTFLFLFSGCGGRSNAATSETGALYIETDPSGAVISLNGAQKGTSPLTLEQLPAGTYKIKASKNLSADTETNAVVKGNQTTTVSIVLNPDANVPGQPTLAK